MRTPTVIDHPCDTDYLEALTRASESAHRFADYPEHRAVVLAACDRLLDAWNDSHQGSSR